MPPLSRTWRALGACLAAAVASMMPAWCSCDPATDPWENPISADRPGAATSTTVMARGEFEIETAFESQVARRPGTPDLTTEDFPTLLRFGVGHSLEVRFESNTVSLQQTVTGFADMSIEAKWLASRPQGTGPSVAFLPVVSLPSGTSDFTAGKVQAGLAGLLDWTLPSGTSLSFNANVSRVVESSDRPYVWQLGSQGAFQIPLHRHWSVSGDLFLSASMVSHSVVPWGADAGVEYYLNPNTQLDVTAIYTFTEPGTATAVQVGVSRRVRLAGP